MKSPDSNSAHVPMRFAIVNEHLFVCSPGDDANHLNRAIGRLYWTTKEEADTLLHQANCYVDLLEALQDCVQALAFLEERTATRTNPPTLQKAREVLAKATGAKS